MDQSNIGKPVLWMVIPCYNEEEVLPITAPQFLSQLETMVSSGKISDKSRILFVNDGSSDATWNIISSLAASDPHYIGISQSRNRGHQNAVLAGLMEAAPVSDITISIDADGQDDITAMDRMVDNYLSGSEIVYGVRNNRDSDTAFKRGSAQSFYKLMKWLGADTVYNHADYRLISSRALEAFSGFEEVNLFLRGLVPLVGFPSSTVEYSRSERMAGESHYPLKKMVSLAFDGITSLSVKPISIITGLGMVVSVLSIMGIIWAIVVALSGGSIAGWASLLCVICFVGGVQLISLGVIGSYIGKIYLETKHRPRYIISERTWEPYKRKYKG